MSMKIRIIGWSVAHIIFLIVLTGCASEEGEAVKELELANQAILRISVTDRNNKNLDIPDSAGIHFFLSQLRSLSARTEGNVNNEFYITFYKGYDEIGRRWRVTNLRMGKNCIGPMVPSSDSAKRWYFENDSLYNFINGKFRQSNSQRFK